MKSIILAVTAAAAFTGAAGSARAALVFEIQRVSDTVAHVTATGTLDGPAPVTQDNFLSFQDPFQLDPVGFDNRSVFGSSTMQVGEVPIDRANVLGDGLSPTPWLYIWNEAATAFVSGSQVSGTLELILPGDLSFAAVGSSGVVNWGPWTAGGVPVGEWTMVAAPVPEPSAVALFVAGLGFVGFLAKSRARR